MIMKILRWGVATLTVFTTIIYIIVGVVSAVLTDKTIPVITIEGDLIEVSVNATDEDLLQGVTAYDEKDGDITSDILVESTSKFTKTGYCKVTYAVCDGDNHVSSATREVHYTDYTAPKFKMSRSLIFSEYDTCNVLGIIGATDCLEGDISDNVIVYSPDYEDGATGDFTLQATVTNAKGDTSTIKLPMSIIKMPKSSPQVVLSEYLIYLKEGDPTPDWKDYIIETVDSNGVDASLNITIKTEFESKPGTYMVYYYGTDSEELTGTTALIVIVE